MFGWFQKKKADGHQLKPQIPLRRMPSVSELPDIYRHDRGRVEGVPNQLDAPWSDEARSVPVLTEEMRLALGNVPIVATVGGCIDGIRAVRYKSSKEAAPGFERLWHYDEIRVIWMFLERIVELHNEVERLRAEQDQTVLEKA